MVRRKMVTYYNGVDGRIISVLNVFRIDFSHIACDPFVVLHYRNHDGRNAVHVCFRNQRNRSQTVAYLSFKVREKTRELFSNLFPKYDKALVDVLKNGFLEVSYPLLDICYLAGKFRIVT